MKLPQQPLYMTDSGIARFVKNSIVNISDIKTQINFYKNNLAELIVVYISFNSYITDTEIINTYRKKNLYCEQDRLNFIQKKGAGGLKPKVGVSRDILLNHVNLNNNSSRIKT